MKAVLGVLGLSFGALTAKHVNRHAEQGLLPVAKDEYHEGVNRYIFQDGRNFAHWKVNMPFLEPKAYHSYDETQFNLELAVDYNQYVYAKGPHDAEFIVCDVQGYGWQFYQDLPQNVTYFLQSTFLHEQLYPNITTLECSLQHFSQDDDIWTNPNWGY